MSDVHDRQADPRAPVLGSHNDAAADVVHFTCEESTTREYAAKTSVRRTLRQAPQSNICIGSEVLSDDDEVDHRGETATDIQRGNALAPSTWYSPALPVTCL